MWDIGCDSDIELFSSAKRKHLFPILAANAQHMQLIEVTDKATQKEWLSVESIIHKGDDNWIPHLKQDIEKVFDRERNKAFQHGEAIRWVLRGQDGDPIGRIAAFVNEKYLNPLHYPVGGVGFFECVNDQEAANMLFDTARSWLKARGMEGMDGDINFGEKNMFWGLLVENFEDPNTYGMDLHPPYYKELFKNYGFQVFYEQLVFSRSMDYPAQDEYIRKAKIVMQRYQITASNVKGYSMERIADEFLAVYNDAWGGHEGFKEMKRSTAQKIIKSMKPVMDPRIVIFAYHEKRPIGFFVNLPELNEIFKHVNGNLNWWGKIKFLYHKKIGNVRTMYGIVFGVVRDWQKKGVEGVLIKHGSEKIVEKGLYDNLIMTWIGDFNPKMVAIGKKLDAKLFRKYATLRYNFDPEREFERHPYVNAKNGKKD